MDNVLFLLVKTDSLGKRRLCLLKNEIKFIVNVTKQQQQRRRRRRKTIQYVAQMRQCEMCA